MSGIKPLVLCAASLLLSFQVLSCSSGGNVSVEQAAQEEDSVSFGADVQPEKPNPRPKRTAFPQDDMDESPRQRNRLPKVTSVALDPPDRVYRGQDITAIPQALDPDGDEVSFQFQWVINGELGPEDDSPTLRGDQFKRGDEVTLMVIPSDWVGRGELYKPLPITIPNAPPKIISTPPKVFRALTYSYQITAEDADGDPITFSLASKPEGMTIDPKTGRIAWEIGRGDSGEQVIEVVAEDGFGGRSFQRYSLNLARQS